MNKKRFILVGFDGANLEMIERFIDELPNFRKLISEGTWGPMLSTVPVDTPTNWTALATGATAAKSRITGFAYHKPGTSLTEQLNPSRNYHEMRAAEFLWEAADRQGKKTIMINYPFAWHSSDLKHAVIIGGDQISGGLPVIYGAGCFCTQDRLASLMNAKPVTLESGPDGLTGEMVLGDEKEQIWSATGLIETGKIIKPENRDKLILHLIPENPPSVKICDCQGNEICIVSPGQWSDYVSIPVKDNQGWVRFFLSDLTNDCQSLQIYHSMITSDKGWTKPSELAEELNQHVGPFQPGEETGVQLDRDSWAGEHIEQATGEVLRRNGNIFCGYAEYLNKKDPDWDQMFIQLHANDGLNHCRLGHIDPEHPCTDPEKTELALKLIRNNYKVTDYILGKVATLAEQTGSMLMVVSDHSAIPTHTWVDTTRPFQEQGIVEFDSQGNWDPDKSKIKFMINHSVYINLKGRQPDGIVDPQDYEKLRDDIISTFMSLRDPNTGECPIAVAARREDLESIGTNGDSFGDVVYLMRPGYTNQPASESNLLTAERLTGCVVNVSDALEKGWTFHKSIQGNHHDYLPNARYKDICSNRAIILCHGPGVKKGYKIQGTRTIDIAPTLAHYAGIHRPAQCEGRILNDLFDE